MAGHPLEVARHDICMSTPRYRGKLQETMHGHMCMDNYIQQPVILSESDFS